MINYKGTPLLGEDSNPQHTSEFFAIAGTVLFWLIFSIFSFVIKPQPDKPKYKEVQIVLSSTPVVQKTEEAPAPAEAASASAASSESVVEQVVETPVVEPPAPKVETPPVIKETPPAPKTVEKKVETPKPKAQPKPEPKKEAPKAQSTNTTNSVEDNFNYSKTVEEMMKEQFSQKTIAKPTPDEIWAKLESQESQNNDGIDVPIIVGNEGNKIDGIAGTQSVETDQKVTSSVRETNKKNNNTAESTKELLGNVKNAKYVSQGSNGVTSETNANVVTDSSGKVMFAMSNSRMRKLLYPDEPKIILSSEAIETINISTPPVTITFKVGPSGDVYDIVIKPSSILNEIVKKDIESQLRTWRFEPADYVATATFEYKIVKQ